MEPNIEASGSRHRYGGQNPRHPRSISLTVHGLPLPFSNSPSLKRKKSSDSASTGTAVTAPEEFQRKSVNAPDLGANSTTGRPFITHRRSRQKLEDQRPPRIVVESVSCESSRKSTSMIGQDGGPSRREHPYEHAIVNHGRRDKGKAVDRPTHSSSSRRSLPEPPRPTNSEALDKYAYSGPLAYAEFERMKKELETWKKTAADHKKQAKKQVKAPPSAEDDDIDPDELADDPNYILTRSKSCPCCRAVVKRRPIPAFLVKSIAGALSKHKAAAEAGHSARVRSPSPTSDDPWKGLFYSSDDDAGDGFESSDEDEVYEDAIGWAMQGLQMGFRGEMGHPLLRAFQEDIDSESGSEFEVEEVLGVEEDDADIDRDSVNSYGSEEEEFETVYVPARWEPPSVVVDPEMYVFRNQGVAASILRMLRRGCTVDMIRLFEITYSHDRGLVAHLASLDEDFAELSHIVVARNNRVYLGWNVHPEGEDYTGELYMRRVLTDMTENPQQWLWTERAHFPGAYDVKLMVRVEDVEHYDTSDTEDWLADDSYV
ncbi:hypothetical protein DXG01_010359 [Tephrocybe rancida]|nr:hypothetical protein DXG01_010359 [Tephrocybe rancida]